MVTMFGLLKDISRIVVKQLAGGGVDEREVAWPDLEDGAELERVQQEETELERVCRQRDEYFEVISRIEKERDELWHMYRVQVSEHLNAQGMLSKERARLIRMLEKVVSVLNQMRKDQGLEPIKGPGELGISLETEEGQLAERYIEDMIQLCKAAPRRIEDARPFGRKK